MIESEAIEGDYIDRGILLFDRSDGRVHRVPDRPSQVWPAPLDTSKRRSRRAARDVLGEDDVRWLPLDSADVLVVNNIVIIPGERVLAVDGQVIR